MSKTPHPCPICGKMTENKGCCSKECYHQQMKMRSSGRTTSELDKLDNTNRCHQCKKPMPLDRYSMYCEECEMHIEEVV